MEEENNRLQAKRDRLKKWKNLCQKCYNTEEFTYRLRGDYNVSLETFKSLRYDLEGTKAVTDILGSDVEDKKEVEFEQEIASLRGQVKHYRRKYKKALLDKDFTEIVLAHLTKIVSSWESIEPIEEYIPKGGTTTESANLMLSDLHIGEVIDEEETAGLSKYNFQIFQDRLHYLGEKLVDILFGHLVGYEFKELNILALGDMVSGLIHEELKETSDLEITTQAMQGAYVTGQFIRDLLAYFPVINFYGISGNHGRTEKKRKYKKRYADWDRVFYQTLWLLLEDSRVNFVLPKSTFYLIEINGSNFLIEHGDNVRMYLRIPYYGMERERMSKKELIEAGEEYWEDTEAKTNQTFRYMCLGHFHLRAELDTARGEMLLNGSLMGQGEYAMSKGYMARPTQSLFGVNKHGLKSFSFPIRLGDAPGFTGYKQAPMLE